MENISELIAYTKKIEARLARLETRDFDLRGRRVSNAADAKSAQDYTTLSQLNSLIASAVFNLPPFPAIPVLPTPTYSFAYNSATQSIPNATLTKLTFNNNVVDVGGIHSTSVNPTRFTCIDAGVYIVYAQCVVPTATSGSYFFLEDLINGATSANSGFDKNPPSAAVNPCLHVLNVRNLVAGDYVEFGTFHDAVGAVSYSANTTIGGIFKIS